MNKVNILMPSCEDPSTTSNFILGARLLEYLINFKNNPGDAFFSFEGVNGETKIYLLREEDEENKQSVFFIFSNNDFCNHIEKTMFTIDSGSVEKIGELVRHIYNIVNEAAQRVY